MWLVTRQGTKLLIMDTTQHLIHHKQYFGGNQVSVWRKAGIFQGRKANFYRKVWQASASSQGQAWLSWASHEHLLLTLLAARGATSVVIATDLHVDPERIELLTLDAGPELNKDWLSHPVLSGLVDAPHPFSTEVELIRLARACLRGLAEIHRLGVVHADFKADNLCLNRAPGVQAGSFRINYQSLRLIDFAFSLSRDNPVRFVLPTDPAKLDYLPGFFREALSAAQTRQSPEALHHASVPAIDLYSLGIMLNRIAEKVPTERTRTFDAIFEFIETCLTSARTGPSRWLRGWNRSFDQPTLKLLKQSELLLHKLGIAEDLWDCSASMTSRSQQHEGLLEQGSTESTPLITPLVTPLLTPLLMPTANMSSSSRVTLPSSSLVAQDINQAQSLIPDSKVIAADSLMVQLIQRGMRLLRSQRLRTIVCTLALAAGFRAVDSLFTRNGFILGDADFWFGLTAMFMSVPFCLLAITFTLKSSLAIYRAWLLLSLLLGAILAIFAYSLYGSGISAAEMRIPLLALFLAGLTTMPQWLRLGTAAPLWKQ